MTDRVLVCGTISLSNRQPPDIYTMSSGRLPLEEGDKRFKCTILGGSIVVEYPDGAPTDDEDDIFRVTRHLVDNTILSTVVTDGIGLSCMLDYCLTDSGEVVLAPYDKAPAIEPQVDRATATDLMGVVPNLRYAIRDFNQGLLHREDSPLYFYCAIEALARIISKSDSELTSGDWSRLHESLGTSREQINVLWKISKSHRHGNRVPFSKEQHLEMMSSTRRFLALAIAYLDKHPELHAHQRKTAE